MHSKINNIEFMIYDNTDKVIEELFESLLNRYQIGLETPNERYYFFFNCVQLLHYIRHKINLNRGWLYIDSPDWKKKQKTTINPINKK